MSIAIMTADGIELPPPDYKGYSAVQQELNQADRNTLGTLIKKRIALKYTITASWTAIGADDKNLIVEATSKNTFPMTFLSTETDSIESGTFYRGSDWTVTGYGRFDQSTLKHQYYDVSVTLTEV